jgi:hypothetical protein
MADMRREESDKDVLPLKAFHATQPDAPAIGFLVFSRGEATLGLQIAVTLTGAIQRKYSLQR